MPDDIAAKIILSVEFADAIEKCKELETGLSDITQAREKDLQAAKSTTQSAEENARAMEKEAEAADKVAEATKRKNDEQRKTPSAKSKPERGVKAWEAFGFASEKEYEEWAHPRIQQNELYRNEYNKRFAKTAERDGQENTASTEDNERLAKEKQARIEAIGELNERKRIIKEIRAEQGRIAQMNNADLDEEIKDQRILVAAKRKQLAIEKEIILQRKLNDVRNQLNDPNVRQDPQKLNEAIKMRDKLERQSYFNNLEILDSERNLRKAKEALKSTNEVIKKTPSVFNKAARGIGRSLSAVARIGGRGLGMEIPTEGLQGPGAAFIAASAAVAGVSMLIRSAMQFRDTELSAEYNVRQRDFSDLQKTTQRMSEEAAKRKQGIDILNEFTQKEELSNSERVRQAQIIKELNYALEGMRVEVDATSGRIMNMGDIGWQVRERDAKRQIEQLDREAAQQQREIDIQNELDKPGWLAKSVAGAVSAMAASLPGVPLFIGKKGYDKLAQGIKTFSDKTFDKESALRRDQIRQTAREKQLDINVQKGKIQETVTDKAQKEYWEKQNASLEDRIKKMRETSQALAYSMNVDGNAWKIRQNELKRYSATELAFLRSETSAKNLRQIQAMPRKTIADQKEYNAALSKYNEKMLQRQRIEQKRAEYVQKEREIERTILDMKKETRLQDMINAGLGRKAELLRREWEIQKKIERDGWDPVQAREWGKLQAAQADKSMQQAARESIADFTRNVKIRQTSTASVMANSLEGLRLQSRQLIANTPDMKLLNVNQKQYSMLEQIKKALDKLNTKTGSVNFETQKV